MFFLFCYTRPPIEETCISICINCKLNVLLFDLLSTLDFDSSIVLSKHSMEEFLLVFKVYFEPLEKLASILHAKATRGQDLGMTHSLLISLFQVFEMH